MISLIFKQHRYINIRGEGIFQTKKNVTYIHSKIIHTIILLWLNKNIRTHYVLTNINTDIFKNVTYFEPSNYYTVLKVFKILTFSSTNLEWTSL